MKKLILVDDDPVFSNITASFLRDRGWEVETTPNSETFFRKLDEEEFSAALVDYQINEESGLDVIRVTRKKFPGLSLVMCTAHGSVESAVEAMKLGAEDYISKPLNYEALYLKLDRIAQSRNRERQLKDLQKEYHLATSFDSIIGKSEVLHKSISLCRSVMNTDMTILLEGETGTGKEMFARAIHFESRRKERPFVVVNCAALHENLLNSELFGHEKGAFTGAVSRKQGKFEIVEDGTIFLDEIGELPLDLQKKLLRVLQENEFERIGSTRVLKSSARVIAATNRNLRGMVDSKRFREDLYFRLSMFPVRVPSLGERREDIPILVSHFVEKYRRKHSWRSLSVPEAFVERLKNRNYSGNIRELEHLVERSVILSQGREIQYPGTEFDPGETLEVEEFDQPLSAFMKFHEKRYLRNLLSRFEWDTRKAAEYSGVSRKTVYQKINEYGLKQVRK
jgi:DNA-binding NtrC family response regulator